MYLNVCVCNEFLSCKKWQKLIFWAFQAQPANPAKGYFIRILYANVVAYMIKINIFYQSKPISLILKIKKLKIQKSKICKLQVYYS